VNEHSTPRTTNGRADPDDRPRAGRSGGPAPADPPYDAIVIGAGICGVVFLRHARARGLRVLALDAQDEVGGLWNRLPAWQDIQNRAPDFALDGVGLDGVHQPDVTRFVRRWVERFDLAPSIRLGCAVRSVARQDGRWTVRTDDGELRTHHLVVAAGAQSEPQVPALERFGTGITELHSSELTRPEDLADRVVTVVGGGASAWDLLDLAVVHGAREIRWVLRGSRWFLPTLRSKHRAWPNLRELAVVQSVLRSPAVVSAFCQGLLRAEYDHFHLGEIEPDEPFDVGRHQLIPGRAAMMGALDEIEVHDGEVAAIHDRELLLGDGRRLETDALLWATGFRMDLDFLGLPAFRGIESPGDLRLRLGSLVRSVDHPDLFFVGSTLLDSTGATPLIAAIQSKSIVAHIAGRTEIPLDVQPHIVAHWDLIHHFARFDRANYPRVWWRIKYLALACWYALARNRSVRI
jgi:cation diffusion facilitator CzcD-associated flavoprotein CzcO